MSINFVSSIAHCLMIGKEMKYRIKKARMPSVRINVLPIWHTAVPLTKLTQSWWEVQAATCLGEPVCMPLPEAPLENKFPLRSSRERRKILLQPRDERREDYQLFICWRSSPGSRGEMVYLSEGVLFSFCPHIMPKDWWVIKISIKNSNYPAF